MVALAVTEHASVTDTPGFRHLQVVAGRDGLETMAPASQERADADSPALQGVAGRTESQLRRLLYALPEWAAVQAVLGDVIDVEIPVPQGAVPNVKQSIRIVTVSEGAEYSVDGGPPVALHELRRVLERIRRAGIWDAIQGLETKFPLAMD